MNGRRITLLCLIAIAGLGDSIRAEPLRRYATVIDVQPIHATDYLPVTRQVCSQPERHGHLSRPIAATIGEDIRQQQANWAAQTSCTSVTENRPSKRVIAYRVTYRYRGHTRTTRLRYHPGERLPVDVSFSTMR